jgi:hypothetical protein
MLQVVEKLRFSTVWLIDRKCYIKVFLLVLFALFIFLVKTCGLHMSSYKYYINIILYFIILVQWKWYLNEVYRVLTMVRHNLQKAVFWTLSIVCILIKPQRFGSWIFFRLQVKKGSIHSIWILCCCFFGIIGIILTTGATIGTRKYNFICCLYGCEIWLLTLRKEHRLRVGYSRTGCWGEYMNLWKKASNRVWRKCHNNKRHHLHFPLVPSICFIDRAVCYSITKVYAS